MEASKPKPTPLDLWLRYVYADIKDRARVREAKACESSTGLSEIHNDVTELITMVDKLLLQVGAIK